jgi:hypothetical protein
MGVNYRSSTAKARPADTTAYASGDLVSNSTTPASTTAHQVSVGSGNGKIKRVGLKRSGTTAVTNGTFRVHLFKADPGAPTNGDNGAIVFSADNYIGHSGDIVLILGTASAIGWSAVLDYLYKLSNSNVLYALVEARGAYTPASGETFQVLVDDERS